jgi:hypothetical protein
LLFFPRSPAFISAAFAEEREHVHYRLRRAVVSE